MALIKRFFTIFLGFFVACYGAVAVFMCATIWLPGAINMSMYSIIKHANAFDAILAFLVFVYLLIVGSGVGVIVIVFGSGFMITPALIAILIFEALSIRNLLVHAAAGGIVGLFCLALFPFDTATMSLYTDTMSLYYSTRLVQAVIVGSGILAGVVYWKIAGRNASEWRAPPAPAQ
jgi:hypothetical protein